MSNLAASLPEKVKELDQMIDLHLAETEAVFPIANPDYVK